MRHYPSDSPEAMARIVALTLLVDGSIDLSELETMKRLEVTNSFGLDDRQFDRVVHDFCDDMMTFAHRAPGGQFELDQKSIDALLDEIRDPELQNRLLSVMLHIVNAEGMLLAGEVSLVSRAMIRWGLNLRTNSDSSEPQRP
jgi:uncharacterized tellurite resistance protein B-like protein